MNNLQHWQPSPRTKKGALIAKNEPSASGAVEGRTQSAITELRAAVQQAELLHSKYYSVHGLCGFGCSLIAAKDYTHARGELDHAMSRSEKMGLRLETAQIHYLTGKLLALTARLAKPPASINKQRTSSLKS